MHVDVYINQKGKTEKVRLDGKEVPEVLLDFGGWESDTVTFWLKGYSVLKLVCQVIEDESNGL